MFVDRANILTKVDIQHGEPDKPQDTKPTATPSSTTTPGEPNEPKGSNPAATLSNTTHHGEPKEQRGTYPATTPSNTTQHEEADEPRGSNPPTEAPNSAPFSNHAAVDTGRMQNVDNLFLTTPRLGDRSTSAFVTWSKPKTLGRWKRPGERVEFARALAGAIDHINRQHCDETTRVELAVFKEPHKDGGHHLHAIVQSNERSRAWSHLGAVLRERFRIAPHVQIGTGRGTCHMTRMLEYTMVPTTNKWELDQTPFFSNDFKVPEKVSRDRAKAIASLKKRPAPNDEVYQWLCAHPSVDTYKAFEATVDDLLDSTPGHVPLMRLSAFLSKNVKDAKKIVNLLLERRDRKRHKAINDLSWADFMERAWKEGCTCLKLNEYKKNLVGGAKWHDDHEEVCKHSMQTIGNFAECLFFDSFKDRRGNLFACGIKGSGKTTAIKAFANLLPTHRVFDPAYESSAPFAGLADHHLLGDFSEFRCRPNINSSTLLLWTERKANLMVSIPKLRAS